MTNVILYSTLGCHLCELAMAEVNAIIDHDSHWKIQEVDIADDPQLMEQYGVKIPVLLNTITQTTLYWPFDRNDVQSLLKLKK